MITDAEKTEVTTGTQAVIDAALALRATVKRMGERTAEKWAAEKAAFAAGKVIQSRYEKFLCNWSDWQDELYPEWLNEPTIEYRIKPWSLTRSLPGFRPLVDGEEWYNGQRFEGEDLAEGSRPILVREKVQEDDEYFCPFSELWVPTYNHVACKGEPALNFKYRTTRPLPALPDPQREAEEAFEKWWNERCANPAQHTNSLHDAMLAAWQAASKAAIK
jgi:hypothetical protein